MMWSVHGMNPRVPSDRVMVADRIRDNDHAGRERAPRAGRHQHHQLRLAGHGADRRVHPPHLAARPPDEARWAAARPPHDNPRILQYLAKYTINPARAHGIDRWVGSLEPGKIADIVLWRPEFFGVKPELVIKGGFVAWGALGEGNASIPQSEPVLYGPHWGGRGMAAGQPQRQLRLRRRGGGRFPPPGAAAGGAPSRSPGTRQVGKRHMLYNQANPRIEIDPRTAEIRIDGQPLPALPDDDLPLNRRYFLL